MSTFLTDIAKALKTDPKTGDKSFYGVVKEKITDGSTVTGYHVSIGGDEDIIEARKMAGANVGDPVMCTLLSNGSVVVTGRRDGDYDAIEALKEATIAQNLAVEAISEVEDLTQHFWYDELGAHVKGDQSGYQTDLTSNGMIINDGDGNPIAKYQSQSVHLGIGKPASELLLCNNSFRIIGKSNNSNLKNPNAITTADALVIQPTHNSFDDTTGIFLDITGSNFRSYVMTGYDLSIGATAQLYANNGETKTFASVTKDYAAIIYNDGGGVYAYNDSVHIREPLYINDKLAATIDDIPDIPSGTILTSSNYSSYSTFTGDVTCQYVHASSLRLKSQPNEGGTLKATWYKYSGEWALRYSGSVSSLQMANSAETNAERLYDIQINEYLRDGINILGIDENEVDEIFPNASCWTTDENGQREVLAVDYDQITLGLLQLIKEQHREIRNIQAQISELKGVI